MVSIFVFLLGLAGGSFVNALVWRLDKNEKIVWARSKCVHCKHVLAADELIPVISFLGLKGQCRHCHQKISWQYPVVELVAGSAFLAIANSSSGQLEKIWLAGLFLVGLVIFIYDLKYTLIPNIFVLAGLVWLAAGILFLKPGQLISGITAGAVVSGFFWALYLISRGAWIGGGDIKLGFLLGLWLGWPMGLVALFLSCVIGAMVGIILIASQKATLKSQIPFGPFLIVASTIVYIYGDKILAWYSGLIF